MAARPSQTSEAITTRFGPFSIVYQNTATAVQTKLNIFTML